MELRMCTVLPYQQRLLPSNPNLHRVGVLPKPFPISRIGLQSRVIYLGNRLPKATSSEETSSGGSQYVGDSRDGVVTLEDVQPVDKISFNRTVAKTETEDDSPVDDEAKSFEFLENLNIKFDSNDAGSVLLYGGSALVAVWLTSAVVSAIDSIPLFPKLMEVVGLGYTFWFTSRYLIFKESRDELIAKIEVLKEQVLGLEEN
ncbi:Protein CURVATURE THYLAKOID 1D, chloroplastic [Quillaja saponaria]|uniref:Protein CURVATURE THYLAKOID 1D, chloroplastic n=1 Tax=Quillaja saponaria TaxID=32244 RepID=A0AAD7KPL6_QUISA|nr:Protein CURVATURE THYLAKOID 1D, chloroplastic [Quillaja saponaria]